MNLFTPPKFAKGSLLGKNGNAYAVLGAFQNFANDSGWEQEDIEKVINEAKSGDYSKLLSICVSHLTMNNNLIEIKKFVELTPEIIKANKDRFTQLRDKHRASDVEFATVFGEILSALQVVVYGYFNNGFFYFIEGNNEGDALSYLNNNTSSEIKALISEYSRLYSTDKEKYTYFINSLISLTLTYIDTIENNQTTDNWRNYKTEWDCEKCEDCESIFPKADLLSSGWGGHICEDCQRIADSEEEDDDY